MQELVQHIVENPLSSILLIFNLIVIESLLSVDNAAVLATMVMDLPPRKRSAALKYGILGAYLFRGLFLFFAAWLIRIWWLKPLGGLYLLYLSWNWWCGRNARSVGDEEGYDKQNNWFYRVASGSIGVFWATVVLIEMMDIAFSIDNVFAAVAFTDNIILVCIGVFIGILAMRFVAQGFVRLMEEYAFLETCAFVVLSLLGLKLSLSFVEHFFPETFFSRFLDGRAADIVTSVLTVAVFLVPLLTSLLFNVPARVSDRERVA
jgi:YkoY family integral membrane protein